MTEHDGKQNVGVIAQYDAIRGLAHVINYMLLHKAYETMNEDGESSFLNTLIVDINRQDEDVVPAGGKKFVMGMIAAVEYTLKELAEKEKAEREGQGRE